MFDYRLRNPSVRPHEVFSPAGKARAEAKVTKEIRPAVFEKCSGRTKAMAHICPARMFARHPDAELRRLARAQAEESHQAHGPCMKWLEPKTRRHLTTIPEPKPGLRPYAPAMIPVGALGYGLQGM